MGGAIAEAVAGAVQGTGNVGIGIANLVQQQKMFNYQKELQERIFQREDNAYQRAVEDMKLAGINPASLNAQTQGGQAGIAQQNFQTPQMQNIAGFNQIVLDMLEAQKRSADIRRTVAETGHTEARTRGQTLENEYNEAIATGRPQKFWKDYNLMDAEEQDIRMNTAIRSELREGNLTLQQLDIDLNRIAKKMNGAVANMTEQDWKYLEKFGISREMTAQERRAHWYKIERQLQVVKDEDGGTHQEYRTKDWRTPSYTTNGEKYTENFMNEVKLEQNLDLVDNYIDKGIRTVEAASQIAGAGGSILRGEAQKENARRKSYNEEREYYRDGNGKMKSSTKRRYE